jgi:hypothetical protein
VNWLDRPIRPGDPFEPIGPCRVRSANHAWLLQPRSGAAGRGRWARIALDQLTPEGVVGPAPSFEYDAIVWENEGSDYRLRIRLGDAPGVLTDRVLGVDGDFR